jgi:hypothetical protein
LLAKARPPRARAVRENDARTQIFIFQRPSLANAVALRTLAGAAAFGAASASLPSARVAIERRALDARVVLDANVALARTHVVETVVVANIIILVEMRRRRTRGAV